MSTLLPRTSSSSTFKPAKSSKLLPSSNSTIISKSLSSLASPRAKDPKTAALLTP
ncbi:hypothetical protein TCARB_0710 [Thermofilum adornatum 1505]|uniref:Uncharacterized protein n=1 Tax=Thermofilum adornatum 1505 TaxID=697581 RepID=A0A3G1A8J8_9CREN|nr:hypothetical protein TCARB_0710 [Thermofilum adornatum 1505]